MDSSLDKKLLGFNKIAQEKLQNIFSAIPGKKDLIIEPNLIKPLEHVCGASWLRIKGVDKIYKFDQKNAPVKKQQIVYLISSNLLLFKHVLDHIHAYQSHESTREFDSEIKNYHVIVFPNLFGIWTNLLEEEGLHGLVSLHRFNWDFLSLDSGVVSLEVPQLFHDVFIKHDTSLLSSVAHSLRLFNLVMKKPKITFIFGENSEKIMSMVHRIEGGRRDEFKEHPDFSAMIVFDRNKDYPSCLLTPVVYSGLLNEIFTAKSGILQIDKENNRIHSGKLNFLETPKEKSMKDISNLKMNGSIDGLFNENKYRHFAEVISLLSNQAKSLGVEGGAYSRDMKINEMKDYVANKLPKVAAQKKELVRHMILCEVIVEELGEHFEKLQTLEESLITNQNKKQILQSIDEILSIDPHRLNTVRLISLLHLTIGLTPDESVNFMTNYLNAFGFKFMSIFTNLSSANLFPDLSNYVKTKIPLNIPISLPKWQNQFQIDAKKLNLIPSENQSESSRKDPSCPSYVFSGTYIPLIAQLASILLKSENFEDISTKLGHLEQMKISSKSCFMKTIKEYSACLKRGEFSGDLFPLKPRTLFVFIVGGVTYAEIAACNLIEKLTGSKIVLASNCIVSGSDLMEAAFN